MVIELIFSFSRCLTLTLSIHLGHLLKAFEHSSDDSFVLRVDDFANVEFVATFELSFDTSDEQLNKLRCSRLEWIREFSKS